MNKEEYAFSPAANATELLHSRAAIQVCYNAESLAKWRYRLGVRTEDSQSSNPGSIPGSATNLNLSAFSCLPLLFRGPQVSPVLAFVLTAQAGCVD